MLKHLHVPAGMQLHNFAMVSPSFLTRLAETPLIFPVRRHLRQGSGNVFVKATECGTECTNTVLAACQKSHSADPLSLGRLAGNFALMLTMVYSLILFPKSLSTETKYSPVPVSVMSPVYATFAFYYTHMYV